jgi:hypothetical protein
VVQLHRRRPERDLSRLRPAVDRLAQNANPAIRAQAREAQVALDDAK